MSENPSNPNALLVGRLSLERCQNYLAHLHALLHLCEIDEPGFDRLVAQSARKLIADLESELAHSATILSVFE